MKKKLLIFDVDGTLWDSEKDVYASFNHTLQEMAGIEITYEKFRELAGMPLEKMFEKALPEDKKIYCNEAAKEYRRYYLGEGHFLDETVLFENVKETLEKFKKDGFYMAVASSKPQKAVETMVKHFELDFFNLIIGTGGGNMKHKPDPEIINCILDKLNFSKEDAVMIGDTSVDVKTGKNAEINTIAVTYGYDEKENLKSANPDYIINEFKKLEDILELKKNRIFVFDLDGTLLRNDKTVSEKTINALLRLKEQNNKILFATARPPRDAYKYVPESLKNNSIICYNGACIIDSQKNILYKNEIDKDNVLKILEIAKNYNYNNICLEINDKLYSNFDTTEFFENAIYEKIDLETFQFDCVYKIILCSKEQIKNGILDDISNIAKGVITDNGALCQIMNKDVSKWDSLKEFTKKENLEGIDIVAFGDDYNDYEMIKNANIGVAMGNAEESIKEIADYITFDNMNEGISKYIENNF